MPLGLRSAGTYVELDEDTYSEFSDDVRKREAEQATKEPVVEPA